MQLITMAHMGEAQGVIETFKLQKCQSDLFRNEDLFLLITGEGPFEAATRTALILGTHKIEKIINLGIAGTLDPNLKKGSIHPVRMIYLIQDLKPQFKTFPVHEAGLDCLTSFERILHPEKAQKLKGMGSLIDREAWGVALAAKTAMVPFTCYKLISDEAGTLESCEITKNSAWEFSQLMVNFLKENLLTKPSEVSVITTIPDFHFTFTTHHRFQTLLSKLSIKEETKPEVLLSTLPLEALRLEKISPKERTKSLLDMLENKIDPLKFKLTQSKASWSEAFEKEGIKVQTDPSWESSKVQLSFEVQSDAELKEKISSLSSLSLSPFLKIMNGDINVE